MSTKQSKPHALRIKESTWVYQCAVIINRTLFHGFFNTRVFGHDHTPASDSFILASNHASFLDPPLAGCFLNRPIYYFARDTLFKKGFISWLLTELYTIPIKRDASSDVSGMKQTFRHLRQNNGLLLFPEGTRSNGEDFLKAQKGIGLLACKTQVPILPTRLYNTHQAFGKPHKFFHFAPTLSLVYGPLLQAKQYDPGKEHPQRYEIAAQRIMSAITKIEIPLEKAI